ncbi:MAG: peptidylprolyl isomerase [Acidobacteriota bacterium]
MKYFLIFALACTPLVAQTPPTNAVPDDAVVANVAGKDLTAGEIRREMAYMPAEFIQLFQQNPKYAVQQLFMLHYLADEAEKAKLDEQSPLKEQLAFLRANSMASAMVSHEHNFHPVSNQEMKEFYDKNLARYQQAKIKVVYIGFKPAAALTGTVPSGKSLEEVAQAISQGGSSTTQRSEADARKLAEDLVKQIRGGADFAKLVAQYSEDPTSKAAGGDFGIVNNNSSYSADVKKAVLALKAGEVTEPLRQSNAFYIIRVEEKTVQPMGDVTVSISEEIRGAHLNQWMAEMNKRFEPTVKSMEFFTQPKLALPGAPAPGTASPGTAARPASGAAIPGNGAAQPAPPAK